MRGVLVLTAETVPAAIANGAVRTSEEADEGVGCG